MWILFFVLSLTFPMKRRDAAVQCCPRTVAPDPRKKCRTFALVESWNPHAEQRQGAASRAEVALFLLSRSNVINL